VTSLAAAALFDGLAMHRDVTLDHAGGIVTGLRSGGGAGAAHALPPDWLLAPGFVDLQVNGAGGVMFNDAPSAAAASAIAAALAPHGTTALLPTLISARGKIAAALAGTAEAIAAGVPGVLGVHIEGPFINPARRGMHVPSEIVPLREDDVLLLAAAHPGVRLLTLAPECVEATQLETLARTLRVFAGHTDATAEQAEQAIAAGLAGFTHLFNAMSQFGSRAPGCVGAALAHGSIAAGIIADGLHVHPRSIRAAWRAMGPDRLFLVSDCMSTVAGGGESYVWDGETIRLSDGRLARQDGTLAGAHVTLGQCVQRAVQLCDIPLEHALRMATATPARHAGADHVGRLAPGCRADMVALDSELQVCAVWQGGKRLR
jgi:N-acetylglucosamine-6-phosphate deacetylase